MKTTALLMAASFMLAAPALAQSPGASEQQPGASQPSTSWPSPPAEGADRTQSTGAAPAADQAPTTGAAPASARISTEEFVRKVAISDLFEIESSKLAKEKASGDVKDFADDMIEDHTESSKELKSKVQAGKVQAQLPAELDDQHRQKLDELRRLSGDQFKQAYARMQVQAHEEAVRLFTAYAQQGDNEELRKWASDKLDDLKEHLEEAKDLR